MAADKFIKGLARQAGLDDAKAQAVAGGLMKLVSGGLSEQDGGKLKEAIGT